MATFNMHRAKTGLSDLVARAEAGEEIVIARRNRPAVKLVPVAAAVNASEAGSGTPARVEAPLGFAEKEQPVFDLDGIVQALAAGKDFSITRDGQVAATVTPAAAAARRVRGFGMLAHMPSVPDGFFFDPLSEEDLEAWEGAASFDPDISKP
ncbi:type II toxin-antitoxin system Phd/YefM family antitoxin [Aurantimonas sp. HBX-1]|uniref:type II toxin-antitoxin system Phd/YefM family antitoxin n=1 Tax=Aurantimonas sp. HBX-1 TaxID=2906072 RepID=UPI001F4674A9|nr:type II toxin-antitoxin system prevent-host-death family antitoxin [Aurantimonas sp. HBX-1]UIJ73724.1 type II toxin-antitoxin system prevent-host-death family antitoxin [Aurantimonas sp. HBX-1]